MGSRQVRRANPRTAHVAPYRRAALPALTIIAIDGKHGARGEGGAQRRRWRRWPWVAVPPDRGGGLIVPLAGPQRNPIEENVVPCSACPRATHRQELYRLISLPERELVKQHLAADTVATAAGIYRHGCHALVVKGSVIGQAAALCSRREDLEGPTGGTILPSARVRRPTHWFVTRGGGEANARRF